MKNDSKTKSQPEGLPRLADSLRPACVSSRQDLEVIRDLFRGKPAYIVQDPITFQSIRLDTEGYKIFASLNRNQTLGEIFQKMVDEGSNTKEGEDAFYELILSLHRLNFLNLPISDDKRLYKRYLQRSEARSTEKLMSFLFFRMPLFNPDIVLNKTQHLTKFLFTWWFFAIWIMLLTGASLLVVRGFEQLIQPIEGILVATNLPFIMILMIILKVIHEFGHAYACKRFGGTVPEMGVFLIVFAPMAYVDASASWGFPSKMRRLLVSLGGVYFESIVAMLAIYIWFLTGPGLLHDMAYNVIFLAGVTTLIFNLNPLMRYDGYYVLSDVTEIPNLRQRATQYVIQALKRAFLGIKSGNPPGAFGLKIFLFTFGVAAGLYKITLVLAISMAIAYKLYLVGLVLACFYAGSTLLKTIFKLSLYLFTAEETAAIRVRAVLVGLVVLTAIPLAIMSVGVPNTVRVAGVFHTEKEEVIRAGVEGFINKIDAAFGNEVTANAPLANLVNDSCNESVAEAMSQLKEAKIRYSAFQTADPVKARQELERIEALSLHFDQRRMEVEKLAIRSPEEGLIIHSLSPRDEGRFLMVGDHVATIASGEWRIKAILTEAEFIDMQPMVGDALRVRTPAKPDETIEAVVHQIIPGGTREVPIESLTQIGGGSIPVDPETSSAHEPYFEIALKLTGEKPSWLLHGMTCQVLCSGERDTLGALLVRKLSCFITKFMQS